MEINCVKGDSIILTDNCSQTFAGVVKSINLGLGRIVLSNVYQLPEYKRVAGYRHFDKDEIVHLEKSKSEKVVTGESVQNGPVKPIVVPEPEPEPQSKLNHSKQKLQSEYAFVKEFGTDFDSAISLLKASTQIGVIGKDTSRGRFLRATILAISTPSKTFLFDLEALGDDIRDKGLKEVLESPNIVKIVHDCRLLSDCLTHKHLINLENVRDIEAEDIMVLFQERRTVRRHSRSLEYLAKVYLGVELDECNETGGVWEERPLPENLLEGLVSHASILLPLQEAIERKYLQKFLDVSRIYNSHVRSLDFFGAVNDDDSKKTLRKDIIKLLAPRNETRSEFRCKKIS